MPVIVSPHHRKSRTSNALSQYEGTQHVDESGVEIYWPRVSTEFRGQMHYSKHIIRTDPSIKETKSKYIVIGENSVLEYAIKIG